MASVDPASILKSGTVTGVGSLPHRDVRVAVDFVTSTCPELPYLPTLPRRSPAESMIAQAAVGIGGIGLGQYGSLMIDPVEVSALGDVVTDFEHDAFGTWRESLDAFAEGSGPIKWQFTGPLTLGRALVRLGVPTDEAFDVAVRAVRRHVGAVAEIVADRLPGRPQIVMIDEPDVGPWHDDEFFIGSENAIDAVSGALGAVERFGVAGLHCCAEADLAALVATGPKILSVPVRASLVDSAVHITRFLDAGGWIAWGAVPTDGPLAISAERWWRRLSDVWCGLVRAGCDAMKIRQQSLITPECGLATHAEHPALRIMQQATDIGERVRTQALATRLTVGS